MLSGLLSLLRIGGISMEHYYSPADIDQLFQRVNELEQKVDELEHDRQS